MGRFGCLGGYFKCLGGQFGGLEGHFRGLGTNFSIQEVFWDPWSDQEWTFIDLGGP